MWSAATAITFATHPTSVASAASAKTVWAPCSRNPSALATASSRLSAAVGCADSCSITAMSSAKAAFASRKWGSDAPGPDAYSAAKAAMRRARAVPTPWASKAEVMLWSVVGESYGWKRGDGGGGVRWDKHDRDVNTCGARGGGCMSSLL